MSNLNNKSILITGGTGSFGKEIIKVLLEKHKLRRIVIFSRDELKQSEMQQKYSQKKFNNLRYFIGDVRDYERLNYFNDLSNFRSSLFSEIPNFETDNGKQKFKLIETDMKGYQKNKWDVIYDPSATVKKAFKSANWKE